MALDEADKMLSLGFAPQLQRLRALLLAQPRGGGSGGKRRRPQVASLDQLLFVGSHCNFQYAWLHARTVQKIDWVSVIAILALKSSPCCAA